MASSGASNKNSLGIDISSAEVNNRANLMAQIRSTGGFAGANLKDSTVERRPRIQQPAVQAKKGKKKLGGPPGPGGMDLVADLKNFMRVNKKK